MERSERVKSKTSAFIAPYIVACYDESRFCDLVLVCEGNRTIPCHKIVLCSLSPRLRELCSDAEDAGDVCYIHLPDLPHKVVRNTLDEIYGAVCKDEVEIQKNEVTEVLGVDCKPLGRRPIVPSLTLKSETKKSKFSDIENILELDHEDFIKSEVEQSLKEEDVEDGMDVNYDFGCSPERWNSDDEAEVKEDEEQAQGCVSLGHYFDCNYFKGSL